MDSSTLQSQASFVSCLTRQQLGRLAATSDSTLPLAPHCYLNEAVVAIIHVEGLEELYQQLVRKGDVSCDDLGFYTNRYISLIVGLFTSCGADALRITHNSVLLAWPHQSGEGAAAWTRKIQVAIQCCLDLPSSSQSRDPIEAHIAFRCGVSSGSLATLHLGASQPGSMFAVPAGDAVWSAQKCLHAASDGQVLVASQSWAQLNADQKSAFDFDSTSATESARPVCLLKSRQRIEAFPPISSPASLLTPAIEHYVSLAFAATVAEFGDSRWASSTRRLTMINSFMSLVPSTSSDTMVSMLFPSSSTHSVEQLKRLNELVLFVQRAVLHFEGLIIDIHLTASGIKFLIVFGLSPVAHSDDPARALLASLALRSSLQAEASSTRWLPDSASFGIASGRVNCLSLGSDSVAPFSATIPRNSLNLIGEARFIAQRLMHAAHGTYGILCDQSTSLSARGDRRFRLERLPDFVPNANPMFISKPQTLRGVCVPARQLNAHSVAAYYPGQSERRHLVGRDDELSVMYATLATALSSDSKSPKKAIMLTSPSGSGKSALVTNVLHALDHTINQNSSSTKLIFARISADDQSPLPLIAWCDVVSQLLNAHAVLRVRAQHREATAQASTHQPSAPHAATLAVPKASKELEPPASPRRSRRSSSFQALTPSELSMFAKLSSPTESVVAAAADALAAQVQPPQSVPDSSPPLQSSTVPSKPAPPATNNPTAQLAAAIGAGKVRYQFGTAADTAASSALHSAWDGESQRSSTTLSVRALEDIVSDLLWRAGGAVAVSKAHLLNSRLKTQFPVPLQPTPASTGAASSAPAPRPRRHSISITANHSLLQSTGPALPLNKSSSEDDIAAVGDLLMMLLSSLQPCVVTIENAQHLSAAAWTLTRNIMDRFASSSQFALLLSSVPLHSPSFAPRLGRTLAADYIACLQHSSTVAIELGPLPDLALRILLKQRWTCSSIDEVTIARIEEKSGCWPSFCSRLADKLLAFNLVRLTSASDGMSASLSPELQYSTPVDVDELDTPLPIPYSTQRSLAGLIDRLTPTQQMLLKAAAVLCVGKQGYAQNVCHASLIQALLALCNSEFRRPHNFSAHLQSELDSLVALNLLRPGFVNASRSSRFSIPAADIALARRQAAVPMSINADSSNSVSAIASRLSDVDRVSWFPNVDLADDRFLAFTSGFLRDVVYDSIPHAQRHWLHTKFAESLASQLFSKGVRPDTSPLHRRHTMLAAVHSSFARESKLASSPASASAALGLVVNGAAGSFALPAKAQRWAIAKESISRFEAEAEGRVLPSTTSVPKAPPPLISRIDTDEIAPKNSSETSAPAIQIQAASAATKAPVPTPPPRIIRIATDDFDADDSSTPIPQQPSTPKNHDSGCLASLFACLCGSSGDVKKPADQSLASIVPADGGVARPTANKDNVWVTESKTPSTAFSAAASATANSAAPALSISVHRAQSPPNSIVPVSPSVSASVPNSAGVSPTSASTIDKPAPYFHLSASGGARRTSVARLVATPDTLVQALLQQHRGSSAAFVAESIASLPTMGVDDQLLTAAATPRGVGAFGSFGNSAATSLGALAGFSQSQNNSSSGAFLQVPGSASVASNSSSRSASPAPRSPSWSTTPHAAVSLASDLQARQQGELQLVVRNATSPKSTPKPTPFARVRALKALTDLLASRESDKSRPPLSAQHVAALQFAMRTLALDNADSERKPPRDFIVHVDAQRWLVAQEQSNKQLPVRVSKAVQGASEADAVIHRRILFALRHIDSWSFDIFTLEECAMGNPLVYMVFTLFHRYDLINRLHLDAAVLYRFVCGVETGYKAQNPYHNATHAADVTQAVHFFLSVVDMVQYMSAEELFCIIIAVALHDYRHPGVTERFCTDTSHELAILYNDIYVMEAFHAAASFQFMLSDPDVDVLANLNLRQRHQMKAQIIQLILATNLTDHFTFVGTFNRMLAEQRAAGVEGQITANNKHLVMQALVKCADVSNPAKPFDIYAEWTARIMEEFYLQGDVERAIGLTISRFMDREAPEVATCQIGFIDFIVAPVYKALGQFSPAVRAHCVPLIESNRAQWAEVQAKYPVQAQPVVAPTPPQVAGAVRSTEATTGVRAFGSAALPNRVFGEGRSPIYDYSYLADDFGAERFVNQAASAVRRLSTMNRKSSVIDPTLPASVGAAALAAVTTTEGSLASMRRQSTQKS